MGLPNAGGIFLDSEGSSPSNLASPTGWAALDYPVAELSMGSRCYTWLLPITLAAREAKL